MRKRNAGELGLAPSDCICDPMDLAALGHMTNCPVYREEIELTDEERESWYELQQSMYKL